MWSVLAATENSSPLQGFGTAHDRIIAVWACLRPEDSVDRLRAKNQAALTDFLSTDLEIGFTLLNIAKRKKATDPEHYKAAIAEARTALDTVRNFLGRIQDPAAWMAIHRRADELETAIEECSK